MKFSIIIPSYNESEDIRLSIESAINQNYPDKEILVVDDSNDNTPEIIKEYATSGVKLIVGPKKGCCGAKNLGIKMATGDIIVILNADVVLPLDFLKKISVHYEKNNADYLAVESEVFNQENFWARFIEKQHRYEIRKIGDKTEWSEGFSFRRQAGIDVGLIPGDFKARFCRDWVFGKLMGEAGFKKIVDRSILVTHKAPDNFKEYWHVRKARGRFGFLMQYFLYKKSLWYLFPKFIAKTIFFVLKFILIVPATYKVVKITSYSDNFLKNILPFFWAYLVQEYARVVGEWEGLIMIVKSKNK